MNALHHTFTASLIACALAVSGCADIDTESNDLGETQQSFLAAQPMQRLLTPTQAQLTTRLDGTNYLQPGEFVAVLPVASAPIQTPTPVRIYENGELCTYHSADWGQPCTSDGGEANCLLETVMNSRYHDGVAVARGYFEFRLTSAEAVANAFPAEGNAAQMTASVVDPSAEHANRLAGELLTLGLNMDLSTTGDLGSKFFGDAVVLEGPFSGWSVLRIATYADAALRDGLRNRGFVQSLDELADELATLNSAAQHCHPVAWLAQPEQ